MDHNIGEKFEPTSINSEQDEGSLFTQLSLSMGQEVMEIDEDWTHFKGDNSFKIHPALIIIYNYLFILLFFSGFLIFR